MKEKSKEIIKAYKEDIRVAEEKIKRRTAHDVESGYVDGFVKEIKEKKELIEFLKKEYLR